MKKYVKLFEDFKSHSQISKICKKYYIENYTINDDSSVDVDAGVLLAGAKFKELPLQFGKVTGDVWLTMCSLTTLKGSPSRVEGDFWCSDNLLTSLEYAPRYVGGNFHFSDNNIYSFEYFPEYIGGDIILSTALNIIFKLFGKKELINLFNEYNIIKDSSNIDEKPKLKVSNLNKFLSDNGFNELEDTSKLEKYYELK